MRFALWLLAIAPAFGGSLAQAGDAPSWEIAVTPALRGLFRPGYPVLLRVSLQNPGPAVEGLLDVVVEGIAYRQPLRVGAGAAATMEVLVAARSPLARASVVLRGRSGILCRQDGLELGLRETEEGSREEGRGARGNQESGRRAPSEGARVLAVGAEAERVRRAVAGRSEVALVGADELPPAAAAFLVADIVALAGDGRTLLPGAAAALADWAREGGTLVFVLAPDSPVHSDSLLSGLGGYAGRPTAREWLRAAGSHRTHSLGRGLIWRVGLGLVAAGTKDAFPQGAFAAPTGTADAWGDAGIYGAFGNPSPPPALRWRLVGEALALLAVGAIVASVVPRRRRGLSLLALLGASAGLTVVAWGLLLPEGRAVVEQVSIVECDGAMAEGRRTDLLSIGGIGRGTAQVSLGKAEAIVPVYYDLDDAGTWRDVVIQRDAQGDVMVRCDVTKGVRRCFAGWRSWRGPAALDADREAILVRGGRFTVGRSEAIPPKESWQALAQLKVWTEAERAALLWQARRAAPRDRLAEASWSGSEERAAGPGILSWRIWPRLFWVERSAEWMRESVKE